MRWLVMLGLFVGTLVEGAEVLETTALKLTIETTPPVHIKQLVHRGSGVAVIDQPFEQDLFALTRRLPDGSSETRRSSQAKRCQVTRTGDTLKLVLSDFPGPELRVEVTVEPAENPALTLWSLRYGAPGQPAFTQVKLPQVTTPGVFAEGLPHDLILPSYPGTRIVEPWTSWKINYGVRAAYPGEQSAQFLAYQCARAGLFVGSRDPASHSRALEVYRREPGFALAQTYEACTGEDGAWTTPYPAVLGVTQGAWYDTADLYKAWATQQPWCRTKLADRDLPGWLKEGPLVHVCEVRTYDKDRNFSGSYYPKLEEHLDYLQQQVGGPVVLMPAGWENHRRWTAGEYFPIFDQERATQVLRRLKAKGIRSFVFLSGLYYTFENAGADGEQIPSAAEHRADYVTDGKTGEPQVFTLGESTKLRPWTRRSYQFCVGAEGTRPFFEAVIRHALDQGITAVQMDQATSGGGAACDATNHHHTPGPGSYQTVGFNQLMDDLREYGRSLDPDFALLCEEEHEELIPVSDAFHMRDYKERYWYRDRPGAVGIPLWHYLYHEYAIGYGGDSAQVGKSLVPWNTRQHAVNLVTGKTPGVSVWSSPQALFESDPAPLTMVRNHQRLLRTRARDCLLFGRMLHPSALEVPDATYKLWSRSGAQEFTEPAVLTSSWQAPNGRVGLLFVNVSTTDPHQLAVDLDARNTPGWPKANLDLYSSLSDRFEPLAASVALPYRLERELAPLEALFVELRSAGG